MQNSYQNYLLLANYAYIVDLISNSTQTITDVAIKNNSTDTINFPSSITAGVGVDKIAPLPPGKG